MRRSPWSISVIGLALGSLAIVGGTVVGGDIGPLAAGYGLPVSLAAVYAITGLAIRERVWQRLSRPRIEARTETVASHRVF